MYSVRILCCLVFGSGCCGWCVGWLWGGMLWLVGVVVDRFWVCDCGG